MPSQPDDWNKVLEAQFEAWGRQDGPQEIQVVYEPVSLREDLGFLLILVLPPALIGFVLGIVIAMAFL